MISKTSKQAISAMTELARLPQDAYEGAGAIAKRINAPRNYLGKMLQLLSYRGLLVSQKGLGGGFRLARKPKDISLFDIVENLDNVDRWSECTLGFKHCSDTNPCAVHNEWKKVKDKYINFLNKTTLADLIK